MLATGGYDAPMPAVLQPLSNLQLPLRLNQKPPA
jgi:hypothetical protein